MSNVSDLTDEPLGVMPERYARVHELVYNHRFQLAAALIATDQRDLARELLEVLGVDPAKVAELARAELAARALAASGCAPGGRGKGEA